MPQLRDFLDGIWPAGAPGATARTGVPVDRSRELAAEVAAITADAGQRAQAARDEAARRVLAQAKDEAVSTVASAVREAARTRELTRQRMPALVDLAIGLIWQLRAGEDQ